MNAKNYAQALKQVLNEKKNIDAIWHNFIIVLKKRGALKLLPKILTVLERDLVRKSSGGILTIATEKDKENISVNLVSFVKAKKAKQVKIKIDSSILGGYYWEIRGELLDTSYKTKLLKLYRTIMQK